MTDNWFETKISYLKVFDDGNEKKVTEAYLVKAVSFTDAERRILKEMTPYVSGEITIVGIQRTKYAEICESRDEGADKWYKCKLMFISLDEKSGDEKRTASLLAVQARNLKDAMDNITHYMKKSVEDYEEASIAETSILEVYP